MAEYGADGSVQRVFDDESGRTPEGADSAEPDFAPAPWYRNRVLLALWALAVALLLTLIIYGLVISPSITQRAGNSAVTAATSSGK
jgi:hypothetical protein